MTTRQPASDEAIRKEFLRKLAEIERKRRRKRRRNGHNGNGR